MTTDALSGNETLAGGDMVEPHICESRKAVVELDAVGFAYAGNRVLEGVTLSVAAGCVFGLLGANGAGKTTTIRLVTGQLRPQSGRVRVFGWDPVEQRDEVHRRIGLMQEDNGHYYRLSAAKNLQFFGRLYGVGDPVARAAQLLEQVGLSEKADAPVGSLSRGMKQRLGVARALVGQPRLLVLDEPTAGLDPYSARSVRTLIGEFCAAGGSVFLTTHYMEEAEELCDQVAILDGGRLACLGNPLDLCAEHLPAEIEVRRAGRLVLKKPGLEELFYHLTGRIVD